ncbi:hypothetical protein LTR12_014290 [Friedmanniomyces endolithicus]|nr:hypothetical protein LTR12_014290 [Friedmanniomyces endolithicus]
MHGQLALASSLLLAVFTQHALAVDKTRDPSLDANLATAATQLDRLALLGNDNAWLFDFTAQEPNYNFAPGGVVNMNAATFPAAKGNGMTMAMLNLGPCSMLPPHYHPRASNYVVAIHGNTTTYMYEENGARLVTETLTPGLATIFPQASMHNIGNVFSNGFPAELVNAAFGQNLASSDVASKMTPVGTGSNWGLSECLKQCGIQPNGTYIRF